VFLYSWPYATLGVTNNVATVSGADFKFGYVLGYCLSCETHTIFSIASTYPDKRIFAGFRQDMVVEVSGIWHYGAIISGMLFHIDPSCF